MLIYDSNDTTKISTNTATIVTASILDASQSSTVSYTVTNIGDNSLDWEVLAGNASDLSDATVVKSSAALGAGAFGTYAVQIAPYTFYGIRIASSAPDTPGEIEVHGRAKG